MSRTNPEALRAESVMFTLTEARCLVATAALLGVLLGLSLGWLI